MVTLIGCAGTGVVKEPKVVLAEWPCPDCSALGGHFEPLPGWYCTTCGGVGVVRVYEKTEAPPPVAPPPPPPARIICDYCNDQGVCSYVNCPNNRYRREDPPPPPPPPVVPPRNEGVTTWTVTPTNSLWRIAARPEIYGDGNRWREIYDANRDQIRNPDIIFPGQVLVIPR